MTRDEWFGAPPSGWSSARLGYFFDVALGKMLNASKEGANGAPAPYLAAGSIQPEQLVIDETKMMRFTADELVQYELRRHDIVVVEGGAGYGRSHLLKDDLPGWGFQNHVARLRSRGAVAPEFLLYCLKACLASGYIEASNRTATLPSLSRDVLRSIPVPLPPLSEQRFIADYLDHETVRIDTLVDEQQRLIDMLRERRDGVVTNTFLHSTSEERALKYAVDEVTVGIVVQPSRWYVDVGVPALRGINLKRGSISLTELVNISEEGDTAHSKSRLRSGDVVVVRTGNAGAAAKVPDELDGANAIDILIIRPGHSVSSDYLVWYLNSPLAAARIQHGSVGALQGHFNVRALRELPLPVASLVEQQRITAYLDDQTARIDTTIAETERFIELSRERRSALIMAAVTGQIDVREMV